MPPMKRSEFLRLMAGGLAGAVFGAAAKPARAAKYDFWFTRLKYDSGDWDVDTRMPSNVLTSLVDYTTLRVDPNERVIALADPEMLSRRRSPLHRRAQAGRIRRGRAPQFRALCAQRRLHPRR